VDLSEFAGALRRAAEYVQAKAADHIVDDCAEKFLEKLKDNTPVLTGALQGGESIDSFSSGGTSASARISTHTPLYASFRETGGEISIKRARVLTNGVEFFGTHVHQEGSWYMRRTVEWAEGALPEICQRAITQILEDAGL
jgi:hypothetical protein